MDTVPTLLDEFIELFNARFAAVVDLAGGTWPEAAGMYGEYEGSEGIGVFVVKRAIDEYVFRGSRLLKGQWSLVEDRTQGTNGASYLIERNGAARREGAKYSRACQGAAAQRLGLRPEFAARRGLVRFCLHIHILQSKHLGSKRLLSVAPLSCKRRDPAPSAAGSWVEGG